MFCNQCQEAEKNLGCSIKGICGKTAIVSDLQDLLIYIAQGLSCVTLESRNFGIDTTEADDFILESLFATITNVNFDENRILSLINRGINIRNNLLEELEQKNREKYLEFMHKLPDSATWQPKNKEKLDEYLEKARDTNILKIRDENIRSLIYLVLYGLKGICAYAYHAWLLGYKNQEIYRFIEESLSYMGYNNYDKEYLISLVMQTGEFSVKVMELLDKANTETYGNPTPVDVYTGIKNAPGILVSGHDLKDLEQLLIQTENTGIYIYTHGEMLPAHGYPKLRKYKHLVGHYGSAWHRQWKDFENFGGPIIMTTNCLQKPKKSYEDRLFTTGTVGWPGIEHIPEKNGKKDFSPVIKKAKEIGDLRKVDGKYIKTGFGRQFLLDNIEHILSLVKEGKIRKFIVMSGCDGRQKIRDYYTEFSKKLPQDTVILTSGCAKYRYNYLELGSIDSLPRIIDAGQCNDSYSLAVLGLKLKEILGLDSINELPIEFNIAWYEQKAVTVLLALLYLGFKNIKLGPTLPAFISPEIAEFLVENFKISTITDVSHDINQLLK